MKPFKATCLLLSLLKLSSSLSVQEFHENLSTINSKLQSEGPSNELLAQFDYLLYSNTTLVSELEQSEASLLSGIHYKKAIIELALGKEPLAMDDFLTCIQIDSINQGAKKNLLSLVLKHGDHEKFEKVKILYKETDSDVQEIENIFNSLNELVSKDSIESITDAINISPLDPNLRSRRIKLTTDLIHQSASNTQEQLKQFISLIDDYSNLAKISPILGSDYLNKLSEIYLFGVLEFNVALNSNKKCIHYDMDNTLCKENSKILNKYSHILSQLSNFNKIYQLWDQDDNADDIFELNEIDIKDISSSLVDHKKFLKIRRVNENFKTNIEFLQQKSNQFNEFYNLKYNELDLALLKTKILDAFLRKSNKELKKYNTEYSKLDKSFPKFFPIILQLVDNAISKKDYNKAQDFLNSCKSNMKKSKFYQDRLHNVQNHRQQQQQQQQHQQQQQYQYHQQHQQQKFHQQKKQPPKNDYYKILDVPKDADAATIKKSYREKTKQFHPDKYKGDLSDEEVQDKMTSINHAYEVLSDENLRRNYDLGEDPNDPESSRGGSGPSPGSHPFGGGSNPFGSGGPFGGAAGPFGNGKFNIKFSTGNSGGFNFGGMGGKKSKQRRT